MTRESSCNGLADESSLDAVAAYWRKLSSSILASSVWSEAASTRLVWITMIAMSDQNGHVLASIPGLARLAAVPLEDAAEAIRVLSAPDPHDRSKVEDGRRIKPVEGGWLLVNFARYQGAARAEADRARKRKWWQENRGTRRQPRQLDADKPSSDPETRHLDRSESESEKGKGEGSDPRKASDPAEAALGATTKPTRIRRPITEQAGLAGDCARLWQAQYGAVPEWGRHVVTLNRLGQRHDHARLVDGFSRFLACDEEFLASKAHPLALFVASPDRWLVERCRLAEPERRSPVHTTTVVRRAGDPLLD